MDKKTVRDIGVTGKKVLVRVDFNVPLHEGIITDDTRMTAAMPTIRYLQGKGARIILVTHLGRPKGKVVADMSTKQLVQHLGELLGEEVLSASDCGGADSRRMVSGLKPGQVVLLENVRFYAGEEKNDLDFAKALAALADVYVNDAFGTAHRAHASTEGVTHFLPSCAGLLLEKELAALSFALYKPEKPFVAIFGGAKVSDKISVIESMLKRVQHILVGGGMANTFLKAAGYQTGKSLVEEDKLDVARTILEKAKATGVEIVLPLDVVVADRFAAEAQAKTVDVTQIPADWMVLDIGPATVEAFAAVIEKARTIVWNGPLGVYEFEKFAAGTNAITRLIAGAKAKTIVGGGDVVAAVENAGLAEKIFHISTGGGASLEFLEGRTLPGVAALEDKVGGDSSDEKTSYSGKLENA